MKILSLRLKNLNSIADEWKIDFTIPRYENDGIFLITGPTGSGKTTILDAICLALYGRTPRQKSFSNNVNEIMPSDQRDCLAEVTFEAGGVHYRSMWSHNRTGAKAQNPFGTPQFYLENADTGDALGKNEEGKKLIQKIIGMNFEQFTRSMLLAQGNFSAFLKSKSNERAEILEQITGTEIYSRISTEVFEVEKKKREEIASLKNEIEEIEILSPEDLERLTNDYTAKENEEKELLKKRDSQKELVDWKNKVQKLEEAMSEILTKEQELKERDSAFEAEREKLVLADRAAEIEAVWLMLDGLRSKLNEQKDKVHDNEKKLPELKEKKEKAALTLSKAIADKEEAEKNYNTANAKLALAQSMDSRIKDKEKALNNAEADKKNSEKELNQYKSKITQIKADLEQKDKEANHIKNWLNQNSGDENIEKELSGLLRDKKDIDELVKDITDKNGKRKEEIRLLEDKDESMNNLEKEIKKLKRDESEIEEKSSKLREDLEKILGDDKLDDLEASLQNLRTEKEQRLLLAREDISKLRANLQDNAPCPVCGSLHHPYAEGQIPLVGELEEKIKALRERIKGAQDKERKMADCEKEKIKLMKDKNDKESDKNKIDTQINIIKQKLANFDALIENQEQRLASIKTELGKTFVKFGLDGEMEVQAALTALQERAKIWKDNKDSEEALKNKLTELKAELNGKEEGEERTKKTLTVINSNYETLRQEYDGLIQERHKEFGDLNEEKVKELEVSAHKSKEEEVKAQEIAKRTDTELTQHEAALKVLQKDLEDLGNDVRNKSKEFSQELEREKFKDEAAFLESKMDKEEREKLKKEDKDIQDEKLKLQTKKNEKDKELIIEKNKHSNQESLAELEEGLQEMADRLTELSDEKSGIKAKLKINDDNKKKAGDKLTLLDALKADYSIYEQLNELIGQKSGDKFRQFAQGLTLEILVAHANRQLKTMSDRYLLMVDKRKALELNIIDNYKAGEVRATSNLSGGESFIVSLALALGLAGLSSKKTRVDSLFLDEGFGTLDEESLETTLATLENLKQQGKLIGIISHVGLLKDRLSTQIELSGTGGRSIIKGPGCSRL